MVDFAPKYDLTRFFLNTSPKLPDTTQSHQIFFTNYLGGDTAGRHIFHRGSAKGKRVQSNMGAKNHGVILPDANRNYTVNSLVGAAFGAAGQRCMALSTAVMVGDAKDWLADVKDKAENLVVNAGHEPGL